MAAATTAPKTRNPVVDRSNIEGLAAALDIS